MTAKQHYWGVDLGGTKIEAVIVDSLEQPNVIARKRIDTEQSYGYEHILSRIKFLIEHLSRESGLSPERIGFGTPGTTDPRTGLLKNSNTQCLNGKALAEDLQSLFGVPCALANDANCFALAESIYGSGRGHELVFGIIMGTGVGGGIVINNTVIRGAGGIAGEWGHNVVNPEGPECYCGKRGCVEAMISGPALEQRYVELSGERKSLSEIAVLASEHPESPAGLLLGYLYEWFGRSLASVINILDPDVVILGGGLSHLSGLRAQGRRETARHVFNADFSTPILMNTLGDSAGVFGAAMLSAEQRN